MDQTLLWVTEHLHSCKIQVVLSLRGSVWVTGDDSVELTGEAVGSSALFVQLYLDVKVGKGVRKVCLFVGCWLFVVCSLVVCLFILFC